MRPRHLRAMAGHIRTLMASTPRKMPTVSVCSARSPRCLPSPQSPLEWQPDVLHCNDWQTALAPAYLHVSGNTTPTVMTVHNLAYQGIFPPATLPELNLPWSCFAVEGVSITATSPSSRPACITPAESPRCPPPTRRKSNKHHWAWACRVCWQVASVGAFRHPQRHRYR